MPRPVPLPAAEYIQRIFRFDPITGKFSRRVDGRPAGTIRRSGHVFLLIDGKHYGAHRIVWLLTHGTDPGESFVDHENHDPADNRPGNLRLATLQQNTRHMRGCRVDSSTGARGVRWRERDQRWYAQITIDGKKKYLGSFLTKELAAECARQARATYFGRFSGEHDASAQA